MGAQMLLPVGASIKFEMIPAFDKISIPNLAAFIGCILVSRRALRLFHRFGLAEVLILMFLVGPFVTAELNTDPIFQRSNHTYEPKYDALSAVVSQLLFPLRSILFLADKYCGIFPTMQILRVLVIAGLLYSLPMLFEVRMSPQLHTWIYGYFPTDFSQTYRDGAFRPVVFMGHGLIVAFFAMTTVVAAAALWRTRTSVVRFPPSGITIYLGAIIILCRTLGALLYGVALVPLVRWANPRLQPCRNGDYDHCYALSCTPISRPCSY